MADIGGRQVAPFDLALMGTGLVAFIDSFLPWETIGDARFSFSRSAWDSGFLAVLPVLVLVAVGVIVALRVFAGTSPLRVGSIGPSLLLAGLGALATLLILIRWVSLPQYWGAGFGLFLGLVVALVATGVSVVAFRASGEVLPGREQQRPLP